MKEKDSSDRFVSKNLNAVPASGIRKYFDILMSIDDVISLGVGEPDYVTPTPIRDAAIKSITQGKTHYTSNYGSDVAEVRSLAVDPTWQAKGLGAALVEACIEDAYTYDVDRVFALTYQPGFFEKQGFSLANVMDFPEKVWNECVRCPFFSNCREIAVVLELDS